MNEPVFPKEVEDFVVACRIRAQAREADYSGPTPRQKQALAGFLHTVLVNKDNRHRVLQAITGLPIASQKQLTFGWHSVLLDEILDGGSNEILSIIEGIVEDPTLLRAWEVFPWHRPEASMPVVWATD